MSNKNNKYSVYGNSKLKKFNSICDKLCIGQKSKIRYLAGRIYAATCTFFISSFFLLATPAYADNNTLQSVINLLKGGVCCIGGACTIWGIVQLGLGLKDGSGGGGQLNGAIAFIIGGAAIFGGGILLGTLDTSWVTG